MRRTHRWTLVALAVLLAAAAVGEGMGHAPSQDRDASHPGREDFIAVGCAQCHGYEGQGGGAAGPRVAPDPLSLRLFMRVVRRPPNVMPAYAPTVLSDETLRRIHGYLESIPEPPEASSLPALAVSVKSVPSPASSVP